MTRPVRIAGDLLVTPEDPTAVAHVIADSLQGALEDPAKVAASIAMHAARFRLARGDGVGLLGWLLELSGDPARAGWLKDAAQ